MLGCQSTLSLCKRVTSVLPTMQIGSQAMLSTTTTTSNLPTGDDVLSSIRERLWSEQRRTKERLSSLCSNRRFEARTSLQPMKSQIPQAEKGVKALQEQVKILNTMLQAKTEECQRLKARVHELEESKLSQDKPEAMTSRFQVAFQVPQERNNKEDSLYARKALSPPSSFLNVGAATLNVAATALWSPTKRSPWHNKNFLLSPSLSCPPSEMKVDLRQLHLPPLKPPTELPSARHVSLRLPELLQIDQEGPFRRQVSETRDLVRRGSFSFVNPPLKEDKFRAAHRTEDRKFDTSVSSSECVFHKCIAAALAGFTSMVEHG